MRYFIVLPVCLAATACFCTSPASAALVDGVVATIDNEVILHSDIVQDAGPVLQELQARAASQEQFKQEADKALREALDQAIERVLLFRQAQLAGMQVTDEQVEERLARIKQDYASDQEFQKMLEEAGETMGELRETVREQVMALSMAHAKQEQFSKEAVVSEAEMRQYYQDHQADFTKPERVNVSRIFLPAGSDAQERTKARAQLEALKEELALGADFAELAKKYSKGPDAESGGLVGWISRGDFVGPLEDAAFSLSAGGLSEVIETDFGYTLLRINEKSEAGTGSFDEVRTEIEPILRQNYTTERYTKWVDELRKRSRVMIYL
ncbi:MAG: peptidyl-prolyl cis-trans isomerase [Candidatus Hydrogenedentes bacterium]|nr:peptidyl-prolyl cis-trans isomerase [Candidatus Hydrogenedentota bacterium]